MAFTNTQDVILQVCAGCACLVLAGVDDICQQGVIVPHMAFCFASVESCIDSVGPLRPGSWSILMYGGISMESSPRGPLTCTVDIGCVLDPLPFAEGAIMLRVTPEGTDSGAEPIFEWHGEVVVKVLGFEGRADAGSRKDGVFAEGCLDACARH